MHTLTRIVDENNSTNLHTLVDSSHRLVVVEDNIRLVEEEGHNTLAVVVDSLVEDTMTWRM